MRQAEKTAARYEKKKNREDAKIKRYENKIESLQKELDLERD